MNLIKSFNLNYLKENIRKSKGLIILLLIIVPLLTTLFTVLFVNGDKAVNLASEVSINWVNMIGMYIVPIGISFALFGYIYKKNSVDLINSMPINKQTIFITNTIGGIILITLMQFITVALLFICGLFCSNLVIFTKMLIDIFIVMWVAYVFIFMATNLAMAISGTFLTQLVLTALILFLVPFITICIKNDPINTSYKIVYGSSEQNWRYVYESTYFTAPIHIPLAFFESESSYSAVSLAKTTVLGIIYLILGVILFKRRKMENTEESFRNEKIHLLVKALTVFPMIVFLNVLNPGKIITIFIIAIIAIYYFAYDFIVKRKVKLIVSIVSLVLTLVLSYALAVGIEEFEENICEPSRKINANDIKEVSIKLDVGGYLEEHSYFIDDEEILNLIINLRSNNTQYLLDNVENNLPKYTFDVNFKTKTGKILKTNLNMYMYSDEFNTLIELLSKNEGYVNHVKSEYINDGRITINGYLVSQDVEEAINLNLKEKISNMTLLEVYENVIVNDDIYNSSLGKVYYDNHKYINKGLDIGISDEISRTVIDYQNKLSSKYIKEISTLASDFRIVGELYCDEIIQLEDYTSYYDITYLNNTQNDIIKFIKDNENVECDPSKDFYQISFYDYELKIGSIFYTNKIDEINEILKKEYDLNTDYYPEDSEIIY